MWASVFVRLSFRVVCDGLGVIVSCMCPVFVFFVCFCAYVSFCGCYVCPYCACVMYYVIILCVYDMCRVFFTYVYM